MTEQKLIDYFYTLFYDECCENFADVYDTKMLVEDCLRRAMREYCEAHGINPD